MVVDSPRTYHEVFDIDQMTKHVILCSRNMIKDSILYLQSVFIFERKVDYKVQVPQQHKRDATLTGCMFELTT